MKALMSPKFGDRKVGTWLSMAENGKIALPSFQRSYVWRSRESIEDYLLAVIQNRPTGVFLLLKIKGKPQFVSRTLRGIDADAANAGELLLDGQQRLTSLWHVLNGETGNVTYYVKVKDLKARNMRICAVESETNTSPNGKALADPATAYARNLVPLQILQDKKDEKGIGQIWHWCKRAITDSDDDKYLLEKALIPLGEELLWNRKLHYCKLGAETDERTAIDIFVQSNKSSVRVNEFDIAVALALDNGELQLRDGIEAFHQASQFTKYYVNVPHQDSEAAIAPLGEWVLFAACVGIKRIAPKRGRYREVVRDVFGNGCDDPEASLARLLNDVEWAMKTIGEHGAPTRQLLPTLPPMHVLAGLRETFATLKKANHRNIGRKLIEAYLCRSFFSDRYEAQGNDRLFADFEPLRNCVLTIRSSGALQQGHLPPILMRILTRSLTPTLLAI